MRSPHVLVQHLKNVRFLYALAGATLLSACTATTLAVANNLNTPMAAGALDCAARSASNSIEWRIAEPTDAAELARWCRAVGGPVLTASATSTAEAPSLDELVTISWNAHLAEGELPALIEKLKSGGLTGGKPVTRFVLLVQELYRRGEDVPAFDAKDRSAFAIKPRNPESPDVDDYAASLGVSMVYVPSMRNGAELREDRGNAIISTEPLFDPIAIELPLARQRRVAIAAALNVRTANGVERLEVVNAHLEPLSSPRTLWVFHNPRGRQVRAILDLLETDRYTSDSVAGVVVGGDFNMVKRGDREEAYKHARAWSTSLQREDRRDTHMMGRLDYVFFRSNNGWVADTLRLDDRFGSDHHPVLATFSRTR